MSKTFTIILGLLLGFLLIVLEQSNLVQARSPLFNFISVLAYTMVGTNLLFLAYKLIDWLIPADIEQEIFEKQNIAAAVFKGLILVGIAIIIAAVIVSP